MRRSGLRVPEHIVDNASGDLCGRDAIGSLLHLNAKLFDSGATGRVGGGNGWKRRKLNLVRWLGGALAGARTAVGLRSGLRRRDVVAAVDLHCVFPSSFMTIVAMPNPPRVASA